MRSIQNLLSRNKVILIVLASNLKIFCFAFLGTKFTLKSYFGLWLFCFNGFFNGTFLVFVTFCVIQMFWIVFKLLWSLFQDQSLFVWLLLWMHLPCGAQTKHWKAKHRKAKHRKAKHWKAKHWKAKHRKAKHRKTKCQK